MISLETTTRGINTVLVIGSAMLTGVFGYTLGGESKIMGGLMFLIFCSLSLLVPVLWEYAGKQARHGNIRVAVIAAFFGAIFFVYDVATNFGTGALFRDAEMVSAENTNNLAKDARNEIHRIEKRIGEIRAQTAWQTSYLAPTAYDSLIEAATLIRDNEKKRGGCGPLCETKTKELADLEANKANALERQALKDEMVTLERELVEAKVKAAERPSVASATISHARNLGAGVTGQMEPDAAILFWANYGLTFAAALACSLAGMVTSLLLGWMAPPRRHFEDEHDEAAYAYERPPQRLSYHPSHEEERPRRARPEPAPHKETVTETFVVSSQGLAMPASQLDNPDLQALIDRSKRLNDEVREKLREMKALGSAQTYGGSK